MALSSHNIIMSCKLNGASSILMRVITKNKRLQEIVVTSSREDRLDIFDSEDFIVEVDGVKFTNFRYSCGVEFTDTIDEHHLKPIRN